MRDVVDRWLNARDLGLRARACQPLVRDHHVACGLLIIRTHKRFAALNAILPMRGERHAVHLRHLPPLYFLELIASSSVSYPLSMRNSATSRERSALS